jgi:RNA polymerase sigma-70 factor, ECF subfamily
MDGRTNRTAMPKTIRTLASVSLGAAASRPRLQVRTTARMALVNGTAGLIVGPARRPFAVVGFTLAHGRIVAIDLITNPDKLRGLALD